MTIVWVILKLGLFRLDHAKLHETWKKELVEKAKLLTEEQYQFVNEKTAMTFGSLKLSYAFFTGHVLQGPMFGACLAFMILMPSLLLYSGVSYAMSLLIPAVELDKLVIGASAVLAAYFISQAWDCFILARHTITLIPSILLVIITVILLIVLQIPPSIVLLVMLVLLFCFAKGGTKHD